ncbi:hypothetical protein RhiJN_02560 [Ceratobasidium sp. AG-Ba]|nr:hypothetical protein RhiJN_02560 [Ceratobasidium sp. AG-Ba]QRW03484.1 hypothetical protein RhiLY_02483 [Ceratobasidium sp. AG-Ba]QRW09596.1 hypothetical protein RhiLY_08595 [Ceratobasidium sp. AG-Ba]
MVIVPVGEDGVPVFRRNLMCKFIVGPSKPREEQPQRDSPWTVSGTEMARMKIEADPTRSKKDPEDTDEFDGAYSDPDVP